MVNYIMLTKNAYTCKALSLTSSSVIRKEEPSFVLLPCSNVIDPSNVLSCQFRITVGNELKTFDAITEEDVRALLGIDDENDLINMVDFRGSFSNDITMSFRLHPKDITVTKTNMYAEINEHCINGFILCEITEKDGVKKFTPLAVVSHKLTASVVSDIDKFNDSNEPNATMSFGTIFPSITIRNENHSFHVDFHMEAYATVCMVAQLRERLEQLEKRMRNIRTSSRH